MVKASVHDFVCYNVRGSNPQAAEDEHPATCIPVTVAIAESTMKQQCEGEKAAEQQLRRQGERSKYIDHGNHCSNLFQLRLISIRKA